jgi:tetratricopeptide (TPR) repeat protein
LLQTTDHLNDIQNAFKVGNRKAILEIISVIAKDNEATQQQLLMVARVAAKIGEVKLAMTMIDKFADIKPDNVDTQLTKASLLAELGQIKKALDYASCNNSSDPAFNHFIGTIRSQLGDVSGALKHFREVVKVWPNAGQTWNMIASLKTFTPKDPDLKLMFNSINGIGGANNLSKATFHYAIGKVQHDLGHFQKAADAYLHGANLMSTEKKYNAAAEQQVVKAIINNFNRDSLQSLSKNQQSHEFSPIFVLGLPRSGTTLIERIISSHSQVIAGGEVDFVQKSTMEMKGMSVQHAKAFENKFAQPHLAWENLAKLYLHLVRERFGDVGRIVDKNLGNSRYLGLISRIFPNSPKLWVRRDPLDAALSCFRTCFSGSMHWSWSFEDIAQHFVLEDLLFEHWYKMFADEILVVPYEEFVTSPKIWSQRVLAHCHLSNENTLSSFHLNKQESTTSSSAQIRKPVYQDSVGISETYLSIMKPFIDNYDVKSSTG